MATKNILIINSGSTSLKFTVYQLINDDLNLILTGGFTNLSTTPQFKLKDQNKAPIKEINYPTAFNHNKALNILIQELENLNIPIEYAAHRVVSGGERYSNSIKLDDENLVYLASLSKIEPTHQEYEVLGAKALRNDFPHIKQSASFDTSFHRAMPKVNQTYAVSKKILDQGVCHYGFHGISYAYLSKELKQLEKDSSKAIFAHLGGGCSLCATLDGKGIDTSMQFGAITGLPMATRSGDFPVDAIFYLLENGFSSDELLNELAKNSGLLALSEGLSQDMQVLEQSNTEKAKFALEFFENRLIKYIGAFIAELEGLDALVFSGGIGENDARLRASVINKLAWLGVKIDPTKNENAISQHDAIKISRDDSTVKVYVIPTNEELMIAKDLVELYNL